MTEWGNTSPESTKQVGGQLIEFIEKTEFGTPEYQAVSDYFHLQQLERSLKLEQANAISSGDELRGKMHWEAQARITEQEIAFHKVQIYQNQSRLKDYESAYTQVGIGFEYDLVDAARREAEQLFAEADEQQNFYIDNLCATFFNKAENIINIKRS
jgi:hypothetical protein